MLSNVLKSFFTEKVLSIDHQIVISYSYFLKLIKLQPEHKVSPVTEEITQYVDHVKT